MREDLTHDCEVQTDDIFVQKSTASNREIRQILLKEKERTKCDACHASTWMDGRIPLILDHVNGIRDDNRRENLRFLCPNCHSQAELDPDRRRVRLVRRAAKKRTDSMDREYNNFSPVIDRRG